MSASDVIGSERMEALLRGDAPRSGAEERRAALLDGLRTAQLRAPEALRARVLAAAPAPAAPRVTLLRRPSRRLALVVVPLAAALAVGAALVHGLVGSGGGRTAIGTSPAIIRAIACAGTSGRQANAGRAVPRAPRREIRAPWRRRRDGAGPQRGAAPSRRRTACRTASGR